MSRTRHGLTEGGASRRSKPIRKSDELRRRSVRQAPDRRLDLSRARGIGVILFFIGSIGIGRLPRNRIAAVWFRRAMGTNNEYVLMVRASMDSRFDHCTGSSNVGGRNCRSPRLRCKLGTKPSGLSNERQDVWRHCLPGTRRVQDPLEVATPKRRNPVAIDPHRRGSLAERKIELAHDVIGRLARDRPSC